MSFRLACNEHQGTPGIVVLPASGFRRARAEITGWIDYAPTPLRDMGGAAREAGVGAVFLKDESARFGLGAAYAVSRLIASHAGRITVVSTESDPHARAVAWAAQRFGADFATEAAEDRFLVADTSWAGYTAVPIDIMQGDRVTADEAADQWTGPPPTHVFVRAGAGNFAAAVSVQMRARFTPHPMLVVIERDHVTRSLLAWQELERAAGAVLSAPAELGSLAALQLAAAEPASRAALGLGPQSRVLLFDAD